MSIKAVLFDLDDVFVGDDIESDIVPAMALGMNAFWKSHSLSATISSSHDLAEIQTALFDTIDRIESLC